MHRRRDIQCHDSVHVLQYGRRLTLRAIVESKEVKRVPLNVTAILPVTPSDKDISISYIRQESLRACKYSSATEKYFVGIHRYTVWG